MKRLSALGAVAAGAAATALLRRHRTLRAVSPELRTPDLWMPLAVVGPTTLALGRRLYGAPTEPVEGVSVTHHGVPGGRDVLVHRPERR